MNYYDCISDRDLRFIWNHFFEQSKSSHELHIRLFKQIWVDHCVMDNDVYKPRLSRDEIESASWQVFNLLFKDFIIPTIYQPHFRVMRRDDIVLAKNKIQKGGTLKDLYKSFFDISETKNSTSFLNTPFFENRTASNFRHHF